MSDIRDRPNVEINRLARAGEAQGLPWYSQFMNFPIMSAIDAGAHINTGALAKLQQMRLVDAARRAQIISGHGSPIQQYGKGSEMALSGEDL